MRRPPEKRTSPRMPPRARKKSEQFTNEPDSRPSSKVIQLPAICVGVEPGRYHGWDIVARRCGRTVLYDRCVAVLSVAECEAAQLAQLRGWRLAS